MEGAKQGVYHSQQVRRREIHNKIMSTFLTPIAVGLIIVLLFGIEAGNNNK